MNHYCRLCLKKDLHNLFFTFSNSLTDSFSVYECYNLLTSINLEHHDDKDNSKICRECWFKLLSLFQFRELALKNHNCVISMKALGNVIKLKIITIFNQIVFRVRSSN